MSDWSCTEGTFVSWDGTGLFYRSWQPLGRSDKAVVLLHRGHEHSGRLDSLVKELGLCDCWAFAWDARGHGHSPGRRGHVGHYMDLVKDLDSFVRYVSQAYGIAVENIAVVANSVGAVTAATWVHDYAPRIRALVLVAPAFRIKLYVPFALPLLRLYRRIKKDATIQSYVKSRFLTHDSEQAENYDTDVLITRDISAHVLLGLHDTATRILADAGAIVTPTLLLSAGSDWVVKRSAHKAFYQALSSPIKAMETYRGFYHALLYEKNRQRPLARVRTFIEAMFSHEDNRSTLLHADQGGYTRCEYDKLCQSTYWPKRMMYRGQRFLMQSLGRLSRGIQLGWSTGFDSGRTLDYVYENRAQGITFLGRYFDRCYLNAVGWQGIRMRGHHLQESLHEAIDQLRQTGKPVHILDVAAGPGRYLLDVLATEEGGDVSAHLQDYDSTNLAQAQTLANKRGLANVTYAQADAFDPKTLGALSPRPNIIIVSGLYELFPNNEKVQCSLQALANLLPEGGFLIYTGQPWHPQLEMIACTLTNREGQPWIMRRRTQAELDALVRSVGILKCNTKSDNAGIFTVSCARKRSA